MFPLFIGNVTSRRRNLSIDGNSLGSLICLDNRQPWEDWPRGSRGLPAAIRRPETPIRRPVAAKAYPKAHPDPPPAPTNLSLSVNSSPGLDDIFQIDFEHHGSYSNTNNFRLYWATSKGGSYTVVPAGDYGPVSGSRNPRVPGTALLTIPRTGRWYKAQGRTCRNSNLTGCSNWSAYSNSVYLSPGITLVPPIPQPIATRTPTPTPTATPAPGTPTPVPVASPGFVISIVNSAPMPTPLAEAHWGVLHQEQVAVDISIAGGTPIPASYEFRLDVLPAQTGFQIAANNGVCDWNNPPAADTHSSGWHSTSSNPHIFRFAQHLVRCGIGNGTAGMQLVARAGLGATPYVAVTTDHIPSAWHGDDLEVTYYIKGTQVEPNGSYAIRAVSDGAGTEGLFPNTSSNFPDLDLLDFGSYSRAAAVWEAVPMTAGGRSASIEFNLVYSRQGADIFVKGYWGKQNADGNDGTCNISVACTEPAGEYPHIGDGQVFWIEHQPYWGRSPVRGANQPQPPPREWTTDLKDMASNPRAYEYLPRVLMHEFGHTIGLGHSAEVDAAGNRHDDIMNGGDRSQNALSVNDSNGLKSIYENHVGH